MIDREKNIKPEDCLKLLCFYRVFYSDYQMNVDQFQVTSELIDKFNEKIQEESERKILFLFECANTGRVVCNFQDYVVTEEVRRRYQETVNRWNSNPQRYSKAVIWDDRRHTAYFNEQLAEAHQFEVYIEEYFRENYQFDIGFYDGKEQYQGESSAGIEIKNDKKYLETGNIYIEYQERMNPADPFVNSGILKGDNTRYFICGVPGNFYIFRKSTLLYLYEELRKGNKKYDIHTAGNRTSRGYIIYGKSIQKYAISEQVLIDELRNI